MAVVAMTRFPGVALFLWVALSTLAVAPAVRADSDINATLDSLYGDHQPYEDFFSALKQAVAAKDKQAVAGMVSYPFKTKISGKSVTIRSAPDFVRRYDAILTPKVVSAIEQQTYDTLFARDIGVMIGSGEVWFTGVCTDNQCAQRTVKIIAVNQ
jgi:hypothetical protein